MLKSGYPKVLTILSKYHHKLRPTTLRLRSKIRQHLDEIVIEKKGIIYPLKPPRLKFPIPGIHPGCQLNWRHTHSQRRCRFIELQAATGLMRGPLRLFRWRPPQLNCLSAQLELPPGLFDVLTQVGKKTQNVDPKDKKTWVN